MDRPDKEEIFRPAGPKTANLARQRERLARALRDNLQRRKAQRREREAAAQLGADISADPADP
jgi:hypothetical protein